ncbi:hypothetical protein F441_07701 [Phytophthora nicotianae CJ01A1]|uniref:RxLR effector protein n=2 Tax=Phytophthora nicotianae TaxID=4792 RepID=W2J562_PHYNI|nr:hypothetical protein L915_07548 [Phytophthora nicotianae]ETL41585.1 hypothetical protein L916_07479 [Phytophthora nicotianae]ETP18025.1 hypothetical protein F441_07701 [Phytophthora nicotianae CJ01A1]
MRLSYIVAVVVAATLHTSACALPTIKESTQATLANVASPGLGDANGGRLLRGVKQRAADKEVQEERSFRASLGEKGKKFWKWFIHGSDTRVKGRSWR